MGVLGARFRPRDEYRPSGVAAHAGGDALTVRWLGTACHVVSSRTTTIVIDPFVTRPGLFATAARPLVPDAAAVARWFPSKVDAVACGHAHYDHLLDAPALARRTGARFLGSESACAFARAGGVAEEKLSVVPRTGATFTVGDLEVRFVPSRHGKIAFGRVPFDGEVLVPPRLPARVWHYRMGGAFGVLVRARGGEGPAVYHNGSADLVDVELEGVHADVVLVGLAGRRATADYLPRLFGALAPKVILPTHHDTFFAPLERGVHLLPQRFVELDAFLSDAARLVPRAQIVLPFYGEDLLVPASSPRDAFLAAR